MCIISICAHTRILNMLKVSAIVSGLYAHVTYVSVKTQKWFTHNLHFHYKVHMGCPESF